MKIKIKIFLIFFTLIPFLVLAQSRTISNDVYFCTDENINLIYFKENNDLRKIYLTSFTNDNKIHIANSYLNDNRSEGDNPINIQSNSRAKRSLNSAIRIHGSINNFAKLITTFNYNASSSWGFLYPKDKIKIFLRRNLDNTLLMQKILKFRDNSKYLYISPKQILGRGYGCGRGIKLIIERLNSPPIINRVNFEYDFNQRNLLIEIDVDEPLSLLRFTINSSRNDQLLFEYSSTTDGQQTSFVIPVSLNDIPPQQRLILNLTIKDLENAEVSKRIGFNTPSYSFNNPILNDIVIKKILSRGAEIWVLTTRVRDLRRERGTQSIINYGTGSDLIQTHNSEVNEICTHNRIQYDCAKHNLTNLLSNTLYNFYVTLQNTEGLVTTSTIRSFKTLQTNLPSVSDLKVNFISSPNSNNYSLAEIRGKIVDDYPPFTIRATLNDENVPISLRNQNFVLRLTNINVSTTSEIVISIKNNLNLERILRFLLPVLR